MAAKKRETVLITGGTNRIGWELSQRSLLMGYDVIAHYNTNTTQAQEWLRASPEKKSRLSLLKYDLRRQSGSLIRMAVQKSPSLHGLVNNAAIFEKGNLSDLASFTRLIRINTLAPLELSTRFSAAVKKGWIINITDARIRPFSRTFQNYRISKLFLTELTHQLAVLLAPRFRVNAIAPGPILKDPEMSAPAFNSLRSRAPLDKQGSIEELLATFAYLTTSTSVTGQTICVDGGWHLL